MLNHINALKERKKLLKNILRAEDLRVLEYFVKMQERGDAPCEIRLYKKRNKKS